ncbi:HNH endonuclease signature motif containing protein [Streptomyces sp. URMC 129]|uniref:HNH endonuclease signature motif containing protein n=1 Tax=Streptomyces sp. URMC 129 TaxID=3423407 RepID=UPI003F1C83BE
MAIGDITRPDILRAVREFDDLGRTGFLRTYGFGQSVRYLLSHEGQLYDSPAIVGAAHGFLPGQAPLSPRDFTGGRDHAVALLRRLGFTVVDLGGADPATRLLDRIDSLRVNRASGKPLLHQPITLLWSAGRARRGEERLLPWAETEQAVQSLLERHGVRGERPRAEYPIAALVRADLWTLPEHTGQVPAAHGDSALRRWFRENRPVGGLTQQAYDLLRHSGETRVAVIDALLARYFEDLDHVPLLTELGLYDDDVADDSPESPHTTAALEDLTPEEYARLCRIVERAEERNRGMRTPRLSHDPMRSGPARRAVLRRSKGRCENPGCTGQPDDVTDRGAPLLEVDHVEDLARGGADHPRQMVALCPNCHAMKTRGSRRTTLRATLLTIAAERHTQALSGP